MCQSISSARSSALSGAGRSTCAARSLCRPTIRQRSAKTWPTVYQTHGFGGERHFGAMDGRQLPQADERGPDPADDLGHARRKFADRHARIRGFGEQRAVGRGADDRADPLAGAALPDGCASLGPLPDRAFVGRLGDPVAADALSGRFSVAPGRPRPIRATSTTSPAPTSIVRTRTSMSTRPASRCRWCG